MSMSPTLLIMTGVAGTSRVDVLGVTVEYAPALMLVASRLRVPVEVDSGGIQRWDSEPWEVDEVLRALVGCAPARIWRWLGDEWERDRWTAGQVEDRVVEVVTVGDADGVIGLDLLGEPAQIGWLAENAAQWPWPVRHSELPTVTGALWVACGDADAASAYRAIREALGGADRVRGWSYRPCDERAA